MRSRRPADVKLRVATRGVKGGTVGEVSGSGHCGLEEEQNCRLHASVGQLARGLMEVGWEQKLGRRMGESQQASREDRRPSENSFGRQLRL